MPSGFLVREQLRNSLLANLQKEKQPAVQLASYPDGLSCQINFQGKPITFQATDASDAYGLALLHILSQETSIES